jgi:hypothetical protein
MITIHTYYCPTCGQGYDSAGCCKTHNRLGLTRLTCPSCQVSLDLSGLSIILLGAMTGGFTGMLLIPGASRFALFYFLLGLGLGVFRLLKQMRAKRRPT